MEAIHRRTAADYSVQTGGLRRDGRARAADVSGWLFWAARHWVVASVLVYGILCNVLIFYYVERSDRRRAAAATLPPGGATETRPPANSDSGVPAAEAADFVEQWPMKAATEDAEAAASHQVFGKQRGAVVQQRLRADGLARRPDSPPWELSSESNSCPRGILSL